jgi:aryl-alcohol dehydrogenase-like predicted oxidoreductase
MPDNAVTPAAVGPAEATVGRWRARLLGVAYRAMPAQIALAWLLGLAANVLLIPGTASLTHLRENIAAERLELDREAMDELSGL